MSRLNKLTESDMEDAIAAEPEKFLGESGLKLVARQYRVGPYIFDLLFEDRHGAKLIVELQLGTLDRNHTYKILDYYDEYKEKRLGEFIELMVVANRIPYERRQRLSALGVNCREIPAEKFIILDSKVPEVPESSIVPKDQVHNDALVDKENPRSFLIKSHSHTSQARHESYDQPPEAYGLFQKQTGLFLAALGEIQPPTRLVVDGRNVRPDNPGNWFTCFSPVSWGRKVTSTSSGPGSGYGSGVGVGYAFYYTKNNNGDHYVRLSSGVENPFKKEFREKFKKDVSVAVATQHIPLPLGCRIWPDTKFPGFRFQGTTLIECRPVPLGDNTWSDVLQNYSILNKKFNELVAQLLKKYYEQGAFSVELDFGY